MEMEIKDKISLRTIYLKKLKNVSKNNYQKWNKIIFNKFNESHYFKQNNVFALYNSLPYEVETKEIIELLLKNLKQVCLPRMNGEHLEFYFINSWNDIVFDNDFKIGQPILNCQKVIGSQIDCMLVPLIAFDKDYYRIGYGKGFYDRYLSKNKFNFSKIGLGFAIQKIPYIINHDNWDIPLDYIFTN